MDPLIKSPRVGNPLAVAVYCSGLKLPNLRYAASAQYHHRLVRRLSRWLSNYRLLGTKSLVDGLGHLKIVGAHIQRFGISFSIPDVLRQSNDGGPLPAL